jgi:hypothetical protein
LIVIVELNVLAGHDPLAGMVFVIVYVPGVEVAKLTCPVLVLTKESPAGEAEKTPALAPAGNTGEAAIWLGQYGPAFENCALGVLVMVTCILVETGQVPPPANVMV